MFLYRTIDIYVTYQYLCEWLQVKYNYHVTVFIWIIGSEIYFSTVIVLSYYPFLKLKRNWGMPSKK